jgi:hypothetical protein
VPQCPLSKTASDRLSNSALIADRRRSASSMTSAWRPSSTASVLIASASMLSLLAIAVTSTVSQRAARPLPAVTWWAYRSILALARKINFPSVNGQPGLVAQQDGVTVTGIAFDIAGDRIKHIWAVRNPEKLRPWTIGKSAIHDQNTTTMKAAEQLHRRQGRLEGQRRPFIRAPRRSLTAAWARSPYDRSGWLDPATAHLLR